MSNVLSIDAAKPSELIIKTNSKHYYLKTAGTNAGKIFEGGKEIPPGDVKGVLDIALTETKKLGSALPADVTAFVKTNKAKFVAFGADKVKAEEIEKAFTFADDIKKAANKISLATPAGVKTIRTRLITEPLSLQFLDDATKQTLINHFDFAELNKVSGLYKEFTGLITQATPDAKKIKTFLIANSEYTDELIGTFERASGNTKAMATYLTLAQKGTKLKDLPAEIIKETGENVTKATDAAKNVKTYSDEIKTLTASGTNADPAVLKEAQANLKKAKESFTEVTKGEYGTKVVKELDANHAGTIKEMREVAADLGTQFDAVLKKTAKTATTTAEKSTGVFKGFFTHTAEGQAKALEAAGEDATKIAKVEKNVIGKVRGGRVAAAIAGIAAVTYVIAAAIGNKGPSERAAEVERREAEPAMAGGRA